jgi:PTS system nitrogen regulatory IIA component
MKLGVREVARYLNVSEDTVYRWIRDGELPCTRISDQYRILSTDLLEWATARGIRVSFDLVAGEGGTEGGPGLDAALRAGGVHHLASASDRESVLRAIVAELQLADESDRGIVMEMVLARESLASTGVGDGIAIPHVRTPIVVHGAASSIALYYLDAPVDFRALDGLPIDTVFFMTTPTPRAHLHLLGRLSTALHDHQFRQAIKQRAPLPRILDEARRVEASFSAESPRGPV